ncbi:MAG TPA: arylsulfatase, partial [Candidatus Saccharimonadia bacterium]|nr:arylsulfatase [Candidatus Saccharimonadia bacterium]
MHPPHPRRFFLLLLLGVLAAGSAASAADRPNIIFILADDLAQGDLGCYGQKLIKTPNLDRMAAEGTRFTQAYSGTSVCAPSRSSLMTGLHMGHCPIRANREIGKEGQMPLPQGTVTVAQILKDAGYATACVGKWGMGMFNTSGSPLKLGFEHFFGYNCQRHAHNYFPTYLYNDDQRISLDGKTYAQEMLARDAERWVASQRSRPFFLFYAITLPHGNYQIDSLGEYAQQETWTKQQQTYAAMVTRLDSDVGRLLTTLKALNIENKTLVIIAGDNGSSFAPDSELGKRFDQNMSGKLRGYKRSLYEGGLRQAAIARWTGVVPAGRVSEEPWAFWDFLPTAAELAGADMPQGYQTDGLSLVSMLKGGSAPHREHFYWELHEGTPIQALRFDNWKAVRNGPSKAIELYDLSADEKESKDLAKEKPDVVAQAEGMMNAARVDSADFPLKDG